MNKQKTLVLSSVVILCLGVASCETKEERQERLITESICAAAEYMRDYGYWERQYDIAKVPIGDTFFEGVEVGSSVRDINRANTLAERFERFSGSSLYGFKDLGDMGSDFKDLKDVIVIYYKNRVNTSYYPGHADMSCLGVDRTGPTVLNPPGWRCIMHPGVVRIQSRDVSCIDHELYTDD